MAKHDKQRQQPSTASILSTAIQKLSEIPAAMTPGRIGFEAYGNHPGPKGPWKMFDGRPIPTWENLAAGKNNDGSPNTGGPLTCERWEVAAGAVLAQQSGQQDAELAALRTSLREFQELSSTRAAEVLGLKAELEQAQAEIGRISFEKGVLNGAMSKSAENYEAFRSDMMVLEQALAGRVPEVPLQTDLGKSAAAGLGELLHTLATLREQRQDGDALQEKGWASEAARQLVEAVPPHERSLLLGDLLAQLLPHTGETGQNETASDVLRRALEERRKLTDLTAEVERIHKELEARIASQSEKMVKVQSAMVARRAPDATAGAALHDMTAIIKHSTPRSWAAMSPQDALSAIVKEWSGLRAFFSAAPLVAVAVRDDGAKVHERFSLLVLNWDGKAVSTRAVEEVRPWGDISPYLDQTVKKALIPGAYR